MTLLLREVVALVVVSAVWLAAAVAVALVVALVFRRESSLVPAIVGALIVGGAAARFGAPLTAHPTLLDRPFPLAWLMIGAVGGIVTAGITRRRRAPSAG